MESIEITMAKIEIEIPEGKRAEWVNGVLTLVDDTPKEPNEVIRDWAAASCYLNSEYKEFGRVSTQHYEALIALNKLFLIAEAWNKIDGFVPDFSNSNQWKYYPWFTYKEKSAMFVYAGTHTAPSDAFASIGSRLCFKTEKRAEQFGRQFIDLWNKVLLP